MMTQTDPGYTGGGGQDDPQERAREIAHDAAGEARSVVDTAQHEAGRVTGEVREQAVHLTESAKEQLHEQAEVQTRHLGEAIGGMGDRLQALADGRPEDAGNAQELVQSIAGQVQSMSDRIDQLGFDGAIAELQRYARRRPGAFLAGAAALGFAAARLTQGARAADDNQSTQQSPSQPQLAGSDTGAGWPPPHTADDNQPAMRDHDPLVLPETAGERMPR